MIAAVVPVSHPGKSDTVIDVLQKQGAFVVAVRDRCDVDCTSADAVVDNAEGDGSMLCRCWDLGIDVAIERDARGIILLGEDCIPQGNLVGAHAQALSRNFPVISLGRTLESVYGWHDKREHGAAAKLHLFSKEHTLIQNVSLVTGGLATRAGNMALNASAVGLIRKHMAAIYGTARVFCPKFDGADGGDRFLGLMAWTYHVAMAYLPMGINAARYDGGIALPAEQTELLEKETARFRAYLAGNPVNLDDISF